MVGKPDDLVCRVLSSSIPEGVLIPFLWFVIPLTALLTAGASKSVRLQVL